MEDDFVVRWAEAELERIMTATMGGAMTVDEQACCEVLAAAVAHLTTCDAAREPDQHNEPLRAENARLRAHLQTIHDQYGKVCAEYELCRHDACDSSVGAWMEADAALNEGAMSR